MAQRTAIEVYGSGHDRIGYALAIEDVTEAERGTFGNPSLRYAVRGTINGVTVDVPVASVSDGWDWIGATCDRIIAARALTTGGVR